MSAMIGTAVLALVSSAHGFTATSLNRPPLALTAEWRRHANLPTTKLPQRGQASLRPHVVTSSLALPGVPAALGSALGGTPIQAALSLNSALAALGMVKGQGMLTPSGLAHAWALGVTLWATFGWR